MSDENSVTIQFDDKNYCKLNPVGSRILELILNGTPILGTFTRGDSKKGNTHPCSPIFGPETNTSFGLPQHGPVRNTLCAHEPAGVNSYRFTCPIEIGTYPKDISIEQTMTIGENTFTIETVHTNGGTQAAPVNFGEHFYWNSPHGWEKVKVNGQDVTNLVKNNDTITLKNINSIEIPEMPPITLTQEGMEYAVLWSYYDREKQTYDNTYVCIEPAEKNPMDNTFGTEDTIIMPHSSRSAKLTISL